MINTDKAVNRHMNDALGREPHHYTISYLRGDGLQAYLNQATPLGGKTLVPPVDVAQVPPQFLTLVLGGRP